MKRIRDLLVLAILSITSDSSAVAETGSALNQWDLTGTWAAKCAAPATPLNPFYTYASNGQSHYLHRNLGRLKDRIKILQATVTPDGHLDLTIELILTRSGQSVTKQMTSRYVKRGKNEFQTQSNHDETGYYTVKNFSLTSNGNTSPRMKRCSETTAGLDQPSRRDALDGVYSG